MPHKDLTRSTLWTFGVGMFATALNSWSCLLWRNGFGCEGEVTGTILIGLSLLWLSISVLLIARRARNRFAWIFWGLAAASFLASSLEQFAHLGVPIRHSNMFFVVRDSVAFLILLVLAWCHYQGDFNLWDRPNKTLEPTA
jgi:hypothetical protein